MSATFTPEVNAEIRRAAATGIYDIRGGGAKRRVPHFDDLESGSGSSLELEGVDDALMSLDMEMVIEEPPSEEVYQREL